MGCPGGRRARRRRFPWRPSGSGDRQFGDSRAGDAPEGEQSHPQAGGHQAPQVSASSPSKAMRGRKPACWQSVVGDAAEAVAGFQGDEGFVGRFGQADPSAGDAAVVGGDDQTEFLFVQAAGDQVGGVGYGRGEAEVQLAGAQAFDHGLAVVLYEGEADAGMVGAEGAEQTRHGLGAHGVQEAEGDLAGGGVGVGAHLVGGPLDLREGPLDGAEERTARGREGDGPSPAGEQLDTQVLFEADHGPGERRLRDLHLLGGAGDVLGAGRRRRSRRAAERGG